MWQYVIMVKTQITVPDELYAQAKDIAKTREWSLAEVFRRGLEYMVSTHPEVVAGESWELPELPAESFKEGIDKVDLRSLSEQDEIQRILG